MWGCGPAVGQWDNQDGKAAAGSVKDCGVGYFKPPLTYTGIITFVWGYTVTAKRLFHASQEYLLQMKL